MQWRCKDGLPFLTFPAIDGLHTVFHAVFVRYFVNASGDRKPITFGLNGDMSGDLVWRHRRRALRLFNGDRMVFANQVHGADVCCLHQDERNDDGSDHLQRTCDSLITDAREQALFIQVADCQPVLCADPVNGVVANIHSGWRGSVANIIGRTIEKMKTDYGCRAEHIVCGIGPSLGPCCAEFKHYRKEIPQALWRYRLDGDRFDFWRLSRDQLCAAGILPKHISTGGMCTRCNQHLFYSYRGERHTGRFSSIIGLRAPEAIKSKTSESELR